MYVQKQADQLFNFKKIILGGLAHFELQYQATKVSNMITLKA